MGKNRCAVVIIAGLVGTAAWFFLPGIREPRLSRFDSSHPLEHGAAVAASQTRSGSASQPDRSPSIRPALAGNAQTHRFPSTPPWNILQKATGNKSAQRVKAGSTGTPAWHDLLTQSSPRARELFETGMRYLRNGGFFEARLAFQTLIRTYPGDKVEPLAYWAMGLSFYREGGYENLLLASDQFQNWLIFFRTDKGLEDFVEASQINLMRIATELMNSAPDEKSRIYATRLIAQALSQFIATNPGSAGTSAAEVQLAEIQRYLAVIGSDNQNGKMVITVLSNRGR